MRSTFVYLTSFRTCESNKLTATQFAAFDTIFGKLIHRREKNKRGADSLN